MVPLIFYYKTQSINAAPAGAFISRVFAGNVPPNRSLSSLLRVNCGRRSLQYMLARTYICEQVSKITWLTSLQ